MERKNQKFYGVLTDEELYLLEDALNLQKREADNEEVKDACSRLVQKIYSNFAELPTKYKVSLIQKD